MRTAMLLVGIAILVGLSGCNSSNLLLPDLKAEPPDEMFIRTNTETGERELWFSTVIANVGEGPLEVVGVHDEKLNETRVIQRISTRDDTFEERVIGNFVFNEAHKHWHFEDWVILEILRLDSEGSPAEIVASTGKTAFCLFDSHRIASPPPNAPSNSVYYRCNQDIQGLSVGWADRYGPSVEGQQLNIDDLPDGRYMIRMIADPEGLVREKDESNNSSTILVEIEGMNIIILNQPTLTSPPGDIPPASIKVERVFPDLSFRDMTNLVQADDSNGLLFVTEQRGTIYAFDKNQPQQSLHVFLDISNRVNRGGNEEGLLGLAFDPDYRENGYFYVYYSAASPRRSVLSRFNVDPGNAQTAALQSEVIIMEVQQPYSNHNGGQIAFGPDGYLYIGLGDGGAGGDPQGNGQNTGTLLGSILRIDVNGLSESGAYKIPADNPFINTPSARPEIWAYGLRNPWRFSFDKDTGLLWAGDVGQNTWEEIDIITRGANYGWNIAEGSHCYSPPAGCNLNGLTPPVVEYNHSQGCSVTGGYVYRGELSSLRGYYIYGDYCSGNIWALGYRDNTVTGNILLVESNLRITSFGQDLAGNLYTLSRDGGIYTLALEK